MYKFWITAVLLMGLYLNTFAQSIVPDTLICGDTLRASFTPGQGQPVDSFFVWLGNCLLQVRFDFSTATIPDAAEMYYVDIHGNRSRAGSMPYFGSDCNGPNHFTQPNIYPLSTAMNPQYCLPGFVEIYGRGIPYEDSIKQRTSLPADFKLGGQWQEGARLHLNIPEDVIGILFMIHYNPDQSTVLEALWDCTPSCCITALGDSLCAGDSLTLTTGNEAYAYHWTGPNGFSSTERSPVIPNITKAHEGWYVVEGKFLFDCSGFDSVYVQVHEAAISISPDSIQICMGGSATLTASGGTTYQWNHQLPGITSIQGNTATVSPTTTQSYTVSGTDAQGCVASATATVVPTFLEFTIDDQAPTCPGWNDGSVAVSINGGQAPFEIRLGGGNWQQAMQLQGLGAGSYTIEVRDAGACAGSQDIVLEEAEAVLATVGTRDPSCLGSCDGAVEIVPLSGEGPFSYYINQVETDSSVMGFCSGNYDVVVNDARLCSWQSTFQLIEAEAFEIRLPRDKKVKEGNAIALEIKSDQELDSVAWDGLCDFNCVSILEFVPDSSMIVKATAWNPAGCESSDSVYVTVKKKAECNDGVFAPTAFTPNGDGINERFTVYADPESSDVSLVSQIVIMNRWGKPVFQRSNFAPNDLSVGWDGYAKGQPVPEGVYTWGATFVRDDGLDFVCGGSVTLVR